MKCRYCAGQVRDIDETIYYLRVWCPLCRKTYNIEKPQPPAPIENPFVCFNHQGKANALVEALSVKYNLADADVYNRKMRFVLTDNDIKGRHRQLEKLRVMGASATFVYPHAARPSMIYDHYEVWEHTTAQFVVNEYHAEIVRECGYKKPLPPIGWFLCPIEKFKRKESVKNILFAPIHPRNAPQDREVNLMAFQRLYKLVQSGEIILTVRYMGDLEDGGLTEEAGVNYKRGRMDQSFVEIDAADVVIGHQTVAWISVARGVPTVMMAEDMPTHFRVKGSEYQDVKSWDKVKHLFQYPLDILEEEDTMSLLNRAAHSDDEIRDWRTRMIGKAFNPEEFVETLESYL